MATFKINFLSTFLIFKNTNVEVSFFSINYSLLQKIVFQGTQKASIVLLEIASNLSMQTFFYGELNIVIHLYHPTNFITNCQNSRSKIQLTIYILYSMPLIVLKVTCSTKSTKTLKIKNTTNRTSVSCNHPLNKLLRIEYIGSIFKLNFKKNSLKKIAHGSICFLEQSHCWN